MAAGDAKTSNGWAVHVFVCERVAQRRSKPNQFFRHLGGHGLTTLVVEDVALGTTKGFGKGGLGQAKLLTDGFNAIHTRIIALLLITIKINSLSGLKS